MRINSLNAFAASVSLGIGVLNGAAAIKLNNEAVTAEATAQALEIKVIRKLLNGKPLPKIKKMTAINIY